MCCCDQPTINGENGYKWQPNEQPKIRPAYPPEIKEGDILLYDEPGRCGGIDSHSFHYRVVKNNVNSPFLLVRHGGGDERIRLSLYYGQVDVLANLCSNDRYWILNAIYHAASDAKHKGRDAANELWEKAAVEKRIRTRKMRGCDRVKVWIEN